MPILNSIINWINFKRIYEIDLFKEHPAEVQQKVLFDLLDEAKNTSIGLKYDFSSVNTEKEFKERVPLQHYEDFAPQVEKLMKGEKNLLWPGEIKWFAKSS